MCAQTRVLWGLPPGMFGFPEFSPGLARRFPFFAPLRTRREVSFRFAGWQTGRLPMTIRANRRLALILATGLLVCFAGPSQAGADADNAATSSKPENAAGAPIALDKYTKHTARHAHRKSSKVAMKSSTTKH